MAEPFDSTIGWWKLENVTKEIGVDAVSNGTPTWNPAKFNNGYYSNNLANYLTIASANGIGLTQGIVSFWFKPNYSSAAAVQRGYLCDATSGVAMSFYTHNGNHTFWMGSQYVQVAGSWSAGDLIHCMLVWDNNAGFDGAKRMALWIDGVEIGSNNTAFVVPAANTMIVGKVITWNQIADGVVDNLKVNNDATQYQAVVDNRNKEGFGVAAPTNVTASDGTYSTHVQIDWTASADANQYQVYRSDDDVTFTVLSGWVTDVTYNDTSAVAGTTYYYRVVGSDGATESDPSASDSGYRAIRIESLTCDIVKPQVLLTSALIDIYDKGYVNQLIKIQEKKTFRRDKLIINSISMKVKNYDNYFSVENPSSPLNGQRWRYDSFKIIDQDNQTIWDGIIKDIERDGKTKTAMIKSEDLLSKYLKTKITYTSSDWETPATSFKNILDAEGFTDYDPKSVQDSINKMTSESCYIKCYFSVEDEITLQQALEKLGEVGCADVYTHKNKIYYKHWTAFTGGVKVNLVEKDIKSPLKIVCPDSELINDYSIGYSGDSGTQLVDSDTGNIGNISRQDLGDHSLSEFDCSDENQIVMKDSTTAQYIGECYIKRSHINLSTQPRPPYIISFGLYYTNREWVDLKTYFRLTWSDENWSEKLFEIYATDLDYDKNNINIIAYEVQE